VQQALPEQLLQLLALLALPVFKALLVLQVQLALKVFLALQGQQVQQVLQVIDIKPLVQPR
jgi:hypothetical protein